MASQPLSLEVVGLFDYKDSKVLLRPKEGITILTGPNGSGKTTILKILRAIVAIDLPALSQLPFREARLGFVNGTSLVVTQLPNSLDGDQQRPERTLRGKDSTGKKLVLTGQTKNGTVSGVWETEIFPDAIDDIHAPPSYQRINDEFWMDSRDGEIISKEGMRRRFAIRPTERHRLLTPGEPPKWLDRFRPDAPPTIIATARLEFGARIPDDRSAASARSHAPIMQYTSQIREYVNQISRLVAEARRESQIETQRADSEFPTRVFQLSDEVIAESSLREQYETIVTLIQDLHGNGLAEESIGLKFPTGEKSNVQLRILKLFLDNWEKKLQPLLPMNIRIQMFRDIVGDRMKDKRLAFQPNGDIVFDTMNGQSLIVESLSSGEQHMLALFAMLLFSAQPNSLVLIDEPEISLHVSWQHEFLADLTRVVQLGDLNVVIATHSPSIINEQWFLVEELDS